MNRAELIDKITGFDREFFAKGLGNETKLQNMPDYALSDLALILQASKDHKETALLPPHPKSTFNRKDSSVIVRIDPEGRMIQNEWGSLEFSGTVYRASGIVSDGKIGLEQVDFCSSRQKSRLSSAIGKPLQIESKALTNYYETIASYVRNPNGVLEFDNALINFKRLSGSMSHEAFDNDELLIPAEGSANFRFNGNWKKETELPADGSKSIEVKPFPFQNHLSVKRMTEGAQIRIDVTQSRKHSEQALKRFDGETTFSFSVLALSSKPETPDSGTIQINLSSVEAGQVTTLDDVTMALLALAPAEIFDSGT